LLKDFTPSDLKPLLDTVGVDKTVLIQIENTLEHTYDLIDLSNRLDWIGAVVGWVDLEDPQIRELLPALKENISFKGLRHPLETETDPSWVMRKDVLEGLRVAAKNDLVFDLLISQPHWKIIPELAQTIPNLPLMVEHFGKPNIETGQVDEWDRMMKTLANFPHVYIKISGVMVLIPQQSWNSWEQEMIIPYIERVIEIFGIDRVVFATDWPVCTLAGSYEEIFHAIEGSLAGFSSIEKSKILGENARRFYNIQ
jgi:L-fuconolactonase